MELQLPDAPEGRPLAQIDMDLRPVYMADRDFRQMVNGVTVSYKKGTVFRDPDRIAALMEHRAPLTRVADVEDLVVCPHCQASFSLRVQRGAQELLERARKLMGGRV